MCNKSSELKAGFDAIQAKLDRRDLSAGRKRQLNGELDLVMEQIRDHKWWHALGCV